jgi:hypothetical protein
MKINSFQSIINQKQNEKDLLNEYTILKENSLNKNQSDLIHNLDNNLHIENNFNVLKEEKNKNIVDLNDNKKPTIKKYNYSISILRIFFSFCVITCHFWTPKRNELIFFFKNKNKSLLSIYVNIIFFNLKKL